MAGLRLKALRNERAAADHEMEATEIAPRGNFVVVVLPMKPTIEATRRHRKGDAQGRWT